MLEKLFNRQDEGYGKFIRQLKDNGMVEIYKDKTAVVYRKRNYQVKCDKLVEALVF